jgi:hypothetical protein
MSQIQQEQENSTLDIKIKDKLGSEIYKVTNALFTFWDLIPSRIRLSIVLSKMLQLPDTIGEEGNFSILAKRSNKIK